MRKLGIGLIGTGFMGKAHALAYGSVQAVMGDVLQLSLEVLCDTPLDKAQKMATQFGFLRATDDWHALIADPAVDVVSITTPNHLHHGMALEALAAGKHVYCEKPMSLTLAEAEEMSEAAARAAKHARAKTMVGYNYIKNPAFTHAQRLIADGVIGDIVYFRGWMDEDYQADPNLPWTWRARIADAGLGTLGDLGCHLVSMAYGLLGPIDSLIAEVEIIHKTRPLPDGSGNAEVENEDIASALVRFNSGVQGALMMSRTAWGRKNRLGWEVHGSAGMICFDQERMNELQLYRATGPEAEQGFTTILTGPEHPPYGAFCPASGHQLGVNDLKVIEVADFLRHIAGGPPSTPDFSAALEYEKVIHAIARAAASDARVTL